ncbi:MAG: glycoside hydrolase [Acidobacteriota bacterium]
MTPHHRFAAAAVAAMMLCAAKPILVAQPAPQLDTKLFGEMRWRGIGPARGGRTKSVVGIPAQPNVFLVGVCNGGVWKTTDYGRTWSPIFDDQPTGSIGAIAVAPGHPDIIYVASGEGLQRPDLSVGDGIYKSADGGKTWAHLGLRDGQQIPQILVDPRDPTRVFVAVLGHPYGPNRERGIFRSVDGGTSFQNVLYKDENTGGADLAFDPSNPDTVYATMWEARQGPWENAAWSGTGGGIYKSTDGGTTWLPLTKGLPSGDDGVVQANLAVAPSNPSRLFAAVASTRSVGIYKSDDAGQSWTKSTTDSRPAGRIGGGDLPVPAIHPTNPDVVFMASTVTWKSIDAGKTWTGFRGAPGGDDYQRIWINPVAPDTMAIVSDQGAIITVNGGQSWSSWYNQPTAQLYHVTADNAWPYRLCSGQQESGSACVASRGNDGQITFREWHPVGVDEYGYVAPDPLDPDIVYGGRSVTRYDRRTGHVQTVGPRPIRTPGVNDARTVRTAPVLFSPIEPRTLFYATNVLWKTVNGGQSWKALSGDLTRRTWDVPASVGKYADTESAKPTQRGVIYTIAPSPLVANRIWIGTDDGLIQVTADGGLSWKDVTPPQLTAWAKVSILDAGHFDSQTAYAAINTLRLDDMRPHIYRTRDGGKTWAHITNGIPDGAPVNVVREDPTRKGLLFAGTEREVYVSFNDGEAWQSLRLNMPATSVRDLIVKDDDIAVATHGRGFWILDNITPLRQLDAAAMAADTLLLKPQTAYRVRWNMNTDMPLPPDEPRAENPPDGAMIDYVLKNAAAGPVMLEIVDAAGKTVRRYASTDPVEPQDPATAAVPLYWYRAPKALSAAAGMHRFLWDLHYQALPGGGGRGGGGGLPSAAVPFDTAPASNAPWAAPGTYTMRLTVNGKSSTQPLAVRIDPRVKTPAPALLQQTTLSRALYDGALDTQAALVAMRALRASVKGAVEAAGKHPVATSLSTFDEKAAALEGLLGGGRGGGRGGRGAMAGGETPTSSPVAGQRGSAAPGGAPAETLSSFATSVTPVIALLQAADVAPTAQVVAAAAERQNVLAALMAKWTTLKTTGLAALNVQLKQAGQPTIVIK